ncbi:CRISPR-associated endonuclease Cas1 [Methanococcoides methylutens]|uniref:CRISPR-associated endonuclease Cas1 n=1 Tax=Methanococcoides methylutens TaxID=2226 RepID=UPI004044ED3B
MICLILNGRRWFSAKVVALVGSEYMKAINSVGLDTNVGFLHEIYQNECSRAYDLQDWLNKNIYRSI